MSHRRRSARRRPRRPSRRGPGRAAHRRTRERRIGGAPTPRGPAGGAAAVPTTSRSDARTDSYSSRPAVTSCVGDPVVGIQPLGLFRSCSRRCSSAPGAQCSRARRHSAPGAVPEPRSRDGRGPGSLARRPPRAARAATGRDGELRRRDLRPPLARCRPGRFPAAAGPEQPAPPRR